MPENSSRVEHSWQGFSFAISLTSQFDKGYENCTIKREYSPCCSKISQTNNGFIRPFVGDYFCTCGRN